MVTQNLFCSKQYGTDVDSSDESLPFFCYICRWSHSQSLFVFGESWGGGGRQGWKKGLSFLAGLSRSHNYWLTLRWEGVTGPPPDGFSRPGLSGAGVGARAGAGARKRSGVPCLSASWDAFQVHLVIGTTAPCEQTHKHD